MIKGRGARASFMAHPYTYNTYIHTFSNIDKERNDIPSEERVPCLL
jgi:hypothetical protein